MIYTYFIDIQTSKELIQMDINKKLTMGIFTMNGEHMVQDCHVTAR